MTCFEYDRHGQRAGRNPNDMSEAELSAAGHSKQALLKVIRAKCLDCCCGSMVEVRCCVIPDCPLWPYRLGENPFSERPPLSEEHRTKLREGKERQQKKSSPPEGAFHKERQEGADAR